MTNKNFGFGTQIRKSPYFDATVRWGATGFSVYNHMYIPRDFGNPEQNFWNLVNDAILCDVAVAVITLARLVVASATVARRRADRGQSDSVEGSAVSGPSEEECLRKGGAVLLHTKSCSVGFGASASEMAAAAAVDWQPAPV